jgi:hypothetical protein
MNINKNNYEAFFLDYHEGNLSPQQVADLLLYLEQHPQLKEEFESFENITFQDLNAIEFENKNELKRVTGLTPSESWDEVMIASVEGILTQEEILLLNKQLSIDAKLQYEFLLYQKTKLAADVSIVFENKKDLKRKEKKVIPIYYYVAVAASILLLMGLFFMFNDSVEQQKLADEKIQSSKANIQTAVNERSSIVENNKEEKNLANLNVPVIQVLKRTKINPEKQMSVPENKEVPQPVIENNIALNDQENKGEQLTAYNEQPATDNQLTTNNQQSPSNNKIEPNGFLSLRELAAAKIKEKIADQPTLTAEKKTGRLKKWSGWDIAEIAAKGFNKFTGRNVEVKPTYNNNGDVIAYSLGAGEFQVTRGR